MRSVLLSLVLSAAFVPQSEAQLPVLGTCPKLAAKKNFDLTKYLGVWYEVEKYFFLPEITGTCVYVRYRDIQSDDVTFYADIVQVEAITRKHIVSPSVGKLVGEVGSAEINLKVGISIPTWAPTSPESMPVLMSVDYPYLILDTDYETYSIKWSCRPINSRSSTQTIWVLSRDRNYSPELKRKVHEKIRELGLNPNHLRVTDQSNCPTPRDLQL